MNSEVYVVYKLPEEASSNNKEGYFSEKCNDSIEAVKLIQTLYAKYPSGRIKEVRLERNYLKIPKGCVVLKPNRIPS